MKKVTAKHLMIGDWVEWRGEYRKVVGLWLNYDRDSLIDLNSVISTKSATPIPITEDWLKLNGFEYGCNGKCQKIGYGVIVNISLIGGTYSISISNYGTNSLVIHNQQYIHQLQQAYRLATSKELKLKF